MTWKTVFQVLVLMAASWAAVVSFMMLTANNPSADDFWRGTGGWIFGFPAGAGVHKVASWLTKKDAQPG